MFYFAAYEAHLQRAHDLEKEHSRYKMSKGIKVKGKESGEEKEISVEGVFIEKWA